MCGGPMPMPMRNPNARLKTLSNAVGSRKTGRVAVIWIVGWGLGSRDAENLGVVPEFLRSTDSISAFGPNAENAGAIVSGICPVLEAASIAQVLRCAKGRKAERYADFTKRSEAEFMQ